jgi:hypothetical protein
LKKRHIYEQKLPLTDTKMDKKGLFVEKNEKKEKTKPMFNQMVMHI